jgi:hypothetical protein
MSNYPPSPKLRWMKREEGPPSRMLYTIRIKHHRISIYRYYSFLGFSPLQHLELSFWQSLSGSHFSLLQDFSQQSLMHFEVHWLSEPHFALQLDSPQHSLPLFDVQHFFDISLHFTL